MRPSQVADDTERPLPLQHLTVTVADGDDEFTNRRHQSSYRINRKQISKRYGASRGFSATSDFLVIKSMLREKMNGLMTGDLQRREGRRNFGG